MGQSDPSDGPVNHRSFASGLVVFSLPLLISACESTGGAAGQVVTATSFADLKMYAESATAYTILVQGTIANGENGGTINVKSNKS
jgi:pectate lyase